MVPARARARHGGERAAGGGVQPTQDRHARAGRPILQHAVLAATDRHEGRDVDGVAAGMLALPGAGRRDSCCECGTHRTPRPSSRPTRQLARLSGDGSGLRPVERGPRRPAIEGGAVRKGNARDALHRNGGADAAGVRRIHSLQDKPRIRASPQIAPTAPEALPNAASPRPGPIPPQRRHPAKPTSSAAAHSAGTPGRAITRPPRPSRRPWRAVSARNPGHRYPARPR